jgi:uncharacterized membrane-anchored protein YitT (DUF2179 family)
MISVNIASSFIMKTIPGLSDYDFIIDQFAADSKNLAKIVLGVVGGITYGILAGISLKIGGSTGGTDAVARHLSKTRGINIGKFNLMFSTTIMFVFLIINDYALDSSNQGMALVIFGTTTMGSLAYFSFSSAAIDYVYPTKKTLQIVIDSKNGEFISEELVKEN